MGTETFRTESPAPVDATEDTLLGTAVGSHYPGMLLGVIGSIEQSATGFTVLRVGNHAAGSDTWEQVAHLVLTPAERDRLIARLVEHRDAAGAVTR